MDFLLQNSILIAIAIASGLLIIVPVIQRRGAKVSQLEATQYMNQSKTLVLDVRSQEEFSAGHLPNSRHIPLNELSNRIKEIEKSKTHVVITVCASGVRSAAAASLLKKSGFEKTFSLDGGIEAWKAQSLPVIK